MANPAIEVSNLTKDFTSDFWKPKQRSLFDVTFSVSEKSIFGLIGHNGAGKTTTIKVLLGLLKATSGETKIFGKPLTETKTREDIGYLPENAYYYDFLTAGEILS